MQSGPCYETNDGAKGFGPDVAFEVEVARQRGKVAATTNKTETHQNQTLIFFGPPLRRTIVRIINLTPFFVVPVLRSFAIRVSLHCGAVPVQPDILAQWL